MRRPAARVLRWPAPFRWAYAMTDDTDGSTLASTRAVYEPCLERGIRPTRFLWTHEPTEPSGLTNPEPPMPGVTLEDDAYAMYCRSLCARGIEFGLHGVSAGNNTRDRVHQGLARFREVFGRDPDLYIAHTRNAENLYWGADRFGSRPAKAVVNRLTIPSRFHGDDPDSPYYWADLCREHIRHHRLFRTLRLNTLAVNPSMPYHDPARPGVRFWFSASAQDEFLFDRLTDRRMDRLAHDDGLVLHYAHSARFVDQPGAAAPALRPRVQRGLDRIGARADVWCPGVRELLDRLLVIKNLVVTERPNAVTIANPLGLAVRSLQIRVPAGDLFHDDGSPVRTATPGIAELAELAPRSAVTLYRTREAASIGDTTDCPRREQRRSLVHETIRLVWQKFRRADRLPYVPIDPAPAPPRALTERAVKPRRHENRATTRGPGSRETAD